MEIHSVYFSKISCRNTSDTESIFSQRLSACWRSFISKNRSAEASLIMNLLTKVTSYLCSISITIPPDKYNPDKVTTTILIETNVQIKDSRRPMKIASILWSGIYRTKEIKDDACGEAADDSGHICRLWLILFQRNVTALIQWLFSQYSTESLGNCVLLFSVLVFVLLHFLICRARFSCKAVSFVL